MPLSDNIRPDKGKNRDIYGLLKALQDQMEAMKVTINTGTVNASKSVNAPIGKFDNLYANNAYIDNKLEAGSISTEFVDTEVLHTGPIVAHPEVVRESATYSGTNLALCKLNNSNLVGTLYLTGTKNNNVVFRTLVNFSDKFVTAFYDQEVTNDERMIEAFTVFSVNGERYLTLSLGPRASGLKLWGWGFNIDLINEDIFFDPMYQTYTAYMPKDRGFTAKSDIVLEENMWIQGPNGEQLLRFNSQTQTIEAGPYDFLFTGDNVYITSKTEGNKVLTKKEIDDEISRQIANGRFIGVYDYYLKEGGLSGFSGLPTPEGYEVGDYVPGLIGKYVDGSVMKVKGLVQSVGNSTSLFWTIDTSITPEGGDWAIVNNFIDIPLGDTFAHGKIYWSTDVFALVVDDSANVDNVDITINSDGKISFKYKTQGVDNVLNNVTSDNIAYNENLTVTEKFSDLQIQINQRVVVLPPVSIIFSTLGEAVEWMSTNFSDYTFNAGTSTISIDAANGGQLNIGQDKRLILNLNGNLTELNSEADYLRVNGGTFALNTRYGAATTELNTCVLTNSSTLFGRTVTMDNCSCTGTIQVQSGCTLRITGSGTYSNIIVNEGGSFVLADSSTAIIASLSGLGSMIKKMEL